MTRILMSAIAIALSSLGTAAAPERPMFTGTWQSDMATLIITDTPARFMVERLMGRETEKLTFTFTEQPLAPVSTAGTEAPRKDASRDDVGGPTRVLQTTAAWHDDHLDTFIMRQINGRTVTQNISYAMNPDGSRLTVTQGLFVHHGYEGIKDDNTVTEVFVKR